MRDTTRHIVLCGHAVIAGIALAACGSSSADVPAGSPGTGDAIIVLKANGPDAFVVPKATLYTVSVGSATSDCTGKGASVRSDNGQLVTIGQPGGGPVNAGASLPGAIKSEPPAPAPVVSGLGLHQSIYLVAGTWHLAPPSCPNWTVTLTPLHR
jgi:hypothetical protein